MSHIKVLVIVTTYNESEIIEDVINDIKKNFIDSNILVIDGYSTDNTDEILKKKKIKTICIDKAYGISLAVEAGFLEAINLNCDYLVRIDGDGQHPASDVKKNLNFSKSNEVDLMIGSRFLDKSDYETNQIRMTGIRLLRLLLKIFYKIDIKDCTSGCQIFSKRLIQKFVEDENFEYSEIGAICKTKKIGYKIVEEFINMKPRVTGSSSFNFMNSFKYMYKNLLSIITSSSFKLK